jgi:RNA polymerase sigma-70 factor, ECF subfamily
VFLLAAITGRYGEGESSDSALVERFVRKDVSAFEELYDRHSRVVYALVVRILQQGSTAEEVVQDVFLHLWRNAGQYQSSRGPFVPWLLTLARNRALDQLRLKSERQRRREDQTEEIPAIAQVPDYEKALDEKRRAERVRSLMGTLSAPQKKAIEMAYFEGLSHSEIAESLQEPLGTVKSWIRNGLLRLKEGLQTAL